MEPRHPIRLSRFLLLAGVAVLAASITQCRMVTDRLVRVEAGDLKAGSCVRACNEAAEDAREEENERHREAIQKCVDHDDGDDDLGGSVPYRREKPDKGDKRDDRDKKDKPGKDDRKSACLATEEARHKAALKAIDTQRRECVNGCHHQGGGKGF